MSSDRNDDSSQIESFLAKVKSTVDIESHPELCNQLLQYYCLQGNSEEAFSYFRQTTQKNTSWSFSASTLLMFSNLIRKMKDPDQAYTLVQYMKSKKIESSFIRSKYETRKWLFAELDEAINIMMRYLKSSQYYKVRMEYIYYIISQAIHERKYRVATSFFADSIHVFKTPQNISDIIVFSGCVEMMFARIPLKYLTSTILPVIEVTFIW